jgi:hypothetical protein
MHGIGKRLETLKLTAVHLDDDAMVTETSELLREAAVIMGGQTSPTLPEDCSAAHADVRSAFSKLILYLSDEKEHRLVDGDPGAWQRELEGRTASFEHARLQFVKVSDVQMDHRFREVESHLREHMARLRSLEPTAAAESTTP